MCRKHLCCICLFFSLALLVSNAAAEKLTYTQYHSPQDVQQVLKSWSTRYSNLAKLIALGKSNGKFDLPLLRLAAQKKERLILIPGLPSLFRPISRARI